MPVSQTLQQHGKLVLAGALLTLLYGSAVLAPWLAPYTPQWAKPAMAHLPPTPLYWHQGPVTTAYTKRVDSAHYVFLYQLQAPATLIPLKFFTTAEEGYPALVAPAPSPQLRQSPDQSHGLHLLGLDANGRDRFSRLLWGGQISLFVGLLSLLIALPIGVIWGGISGLAGGKVDAVMMRIAEVLMSIPGLYLLMSLSTLLPTELSSSTRFLLVSCLLSFVGWAPFSRVVRGLVLSVKEREFVDAARTQGASFWRILTRHILPQTYGYLIVSSALALPAAILAESSLSFLGLGIQEPDSSWGNMLREAQNIATLTESPWTLAPGALILLTVLAFNLLGEWLRERFGDTLPTK